MCMPWICIYTTSIYACDCTTCTAQMNFLLSSVASPAFSTQIFEVEMKCLLSKVHIYWTLCVNVHCGIQSTLHNILPNLLKLVSQKLSILSEKDSPWGILEPTTNHTAWTIRWLTASRWDTSSTKHGSVICMIAIWFKIPTWHLSLKMERFSW